MHQSRMLYIHSKYVLVQFSGTNSMRAVFHRLDRLLGQRLDLHEPLRGDQRLDDGLAALALADG